MRSIQLLVPFCLVCLVVEQAQAQNRRIEAVADRPAVAAAEAGRSPGTPADVLSEEEWRRVDAAVARALDWLAAQQLPDGSFPTLDSCQPGVTSLCVMAFLAHGRMPGEGPYGPCLDRAVDYVLNCQKQNGLVCLLGPDVPTLTRQVPHSVGETATYNHGISSLMLSELYGMSYPPRAEPLQEAITKALAVTLQIQRWPKGHPADRGGWRYLDEQGVDSDLSASGWQLMSLRSARNAGFDVPAEPIDDAVAYVRRCFDSQAGVFTYSPRKLRPTRAMAGAGILALGHAGYHNSTEARRSGDWVLRHSFDNYNPPTDSTDQRWYHYGMFNCCQGMYQLGGRHWEEFFPRAIKPLLANQRRDGSWPPEGYAADAAFGNAYTTALAVLSLGAANQLLPIFQR